MILSCRSDVAFAAADRADGKRLGMDEVSLAPATPEQLVSAVGEVAPVGVHLVNERVLGVHHAEIEYVVPLFHGHIIPNRTAIGSNFFSRKERKGRKDLFARHSRSLGVVRSNREPPTSGGYP